MANSRQNVKKLVKDGFIIRKPAKINSRSRARRMKEAKVRRVVLTPSISVVYMNPNRSLDVVMEFTVCLQSRGCQRWELTISVCQSYITQWSFPIVHSIIDQTINTCIELAFALARQLFGLYITPKTQMMSGF